jgi:hypothetical protein
VVRKPPAELLRSCETYRPIVLKTTSDLVDENAALWEAYNRCISQTGSLAAWNKRH